MAHQYPSDAFQERNLPFNIGDLLRNPVADFRAVRPWKGTQGEQFLNLSKGETQFLCLLDEANCKRRIVGIDAIISRTAKRLR
jgi:hypothetical protein